MTAATRVELHIRRLVWDGAGPPPSPAALCAAVESELAVLLGDSPTIGAVAPAVPADSTIGAPTPAAPTDPTLAAHARQIARAVHETLRAGQPPDHRSPQHRPRPEAGAPTP
ncbi:hypothetical protein [Streptomyces sp. NPDC023838]|uniref:hypothetical protein n=1 Tax=Streptomyces sp. NPDC023838 TaxID=3154325 RepID=UPI0033E54A17